MGVEGNPGDRGPPRIRLEAPHASRREEFLAAVNASRALHRPWVNPPSTTAGFRAYLEKLGSPRELGFFIVTADSISMLSEACATGKPVHMFDLGTGAAAMRPRAEAGDNDLRLSGLLYRALMRWGPQRLSRDITLVHQRLLREGRGSWLGEAGPAGATPGLQDIDRAVARVKALVDNAV